MKLDIPGIFEIIVRKVSLAKLGQIDCHRHFLTTIVQMNLLFIHFDDVRSIKTVECTINIFSTIGGTDR